MDNVTNNIGDVCLPKWPAFIVSGEKVTEDQAAEIIIRTDACLPCFVYASNDSEFEEQLCGLFGVPYKPDLGHNRGSNITHFEKLSSLMKRLGKIECGYISNHQIISCYIGGPHGWCNWSGSIFTNTTNIGKWPDVETVAEDWGKIAEAFPFLNLTCQLYDKEVCEDGGKPVVEFRVMNGTVEVRVPQTQLAPPVDDFNLVNFYNPGRERGVSINGLRRKLKTLYGTIPQYGD